jgi:surfeit locus 1 family protein
MKPPRWLVWWLLTLLVAVGLASLGRWQSHRAVEKQTMLDAVAATLAERRPSPLAAQSRAPGTGYDWTEGDGDFLTAPALLLDNQRHGDAVGVREYRVFQPTGGRAVLVDLGWRPMHGDRELPPPQLLQTPARLRGLMAPPPASGIAMGPAYIESARDRWLLMRLDLPALSTALKLDLAPRVLRLDPALPIGSARDLDVLPNTLTPDRHRGYALQWYALSVAMLVIALVLTFRTFRRKKP